MWGLPPIPVGASLNTMATVKEVPSVLPEKIYGLGKWSLLLRDFRRTLPLYNSSKSTSMFYIKQKPELLGQRIMIPAAGPSI